MIFRREPIHKRLARQGGLEAGEEIATGEAPRQAPDPGPRWGLTGVDGVARPRRWDTVAPADAPGLEGDEVHFVALPNGDLVVDEEEPENTLAPLAEAVEETLQPPYRAEAIRRDGESWSVAARRIEVAEFDASGEELELVSADGGRALTVDGERAFGSVPELEDLGARQGASYVVRARRLDGRFWEVETHAL